MGCFSCYVKDIHGAADNGAPYKSSHSAGNDGFYRASDPTPKGAQVVKVQPIAVPAISVDELKEITDNFGNHELIGEGSYGRVYYGVLKNGRAAAIKKLDTSKQPDQELLAQVCRIANIVFLDNFNFHLLPDRRP